MREIQHACSLSPKRREIQSSNEVKNVFFLHFWHNNWKSWLLAPLVRDIQSSFWNQKRKFFDTRLEKNIFWLQKAFFFLDFFASRKSCEKHFFFLFRCAQAKEIDFLKNELEKNSDRQITNFCAKNTLAISKGQFIYIFRKTIIVWKPWFLSSSLCIGPRNIKNNGPEIKSFQQRKSVF